MPFSASQFVIIRQQTNVIENTFYYSGILYKLWFISFLFKVIFCWWIHAFWNIYW